MKRLTDFPLHLQIFFAFSCALLIVVICTIVLWLWNDDDNRHLNAFATFSELVEQNLPPADAPQPVQAAAIDRWMARAHTRFTLFAANGERLSRPLDPPIAFPSRTVYGQLDDDWYGMRFVWPLKDKRVLVTQFSSDRQKRPWLFILLLLGLASCVALISFPVIRRLTARLESLQQSVESLGQGNLTARVAVSGRDEVGRLAASFNRSAMQIEQLIQAQKSILANASHELRSPLMRIQMAAALLAPEDSPTRRELQRSVGELDALVEEILTLSRLEMATRAINADFHPADITAIAAEECAAAQVELQAEHVVAEVDARLIRRLLRNLIENAQRYAGSGICVVLKHTEERCFLLEVLDRGPGIPCAERESIFQPFYRLAHSSSGYGLGLALVRSITEYHAGSISVHDRAGGGAHFCVCLPLAVT
ncbi:HAMP domain-containing sensor histidine kinase [Candidatus Pantoea floridensis]|uniref:histidine kinase n=1 Tax=Candidatus Pantoea floridensis TaxID=1938870 RepID=A0A286DL16_9GAMM|nr:HAMP domain-containing sensor histidine kinase [Pantoea floridensis]PIF14881.1 signal transduction histidine kinase [Enterobacteriaceae bacterium JKS000233]SOD59311.1 Signal transduction histidine kinase [Pantoea floridensis]